MSVWGGVGGHERRVRRRNDGSKPSKLTSKGTSIRFSSTQVPISKALGNSSGSKQPGGARAGHEISSSPSPSSSSPSLSTSVPELPSLGLTSSPSDKGGCSERGVMALFPVGGLEEEEGEGMAMGCEPALSEGEGEVDLSGREKEACGLASRRGAQCSKG